jgi:hypothetical protein
LRRECHIQNIIEAHRNSAPILITIRCDLTFVGQVQSLDVLGWGSTPYSPRGALKNHSNIALSNHSRLTHMSVSSQSHSHVILALQLATNPNRKLKGEFPQRPCAAQDRLTQRDCVGARTVGAKRHVVTQHMGRSIGCATCSY